MQQVLQSQLHEFYTILYEIFHRPRRDSLECTHTHTSNFLAMVHPKTIERKTETNYGMHYKSSNIQDITTNKVLFNNRYNQIYRQISCL